MQSRSQPPADPVSSFLAVASAAAANMAQQAGESFERDVRVVPSALHEGDPLLTVSGLEWSWSQSDSRVRVRVMLPEGVDAAALDVTIADNAILVLVRGVDSRPAWFAPLAGQIVVSESSWRVADAEWCFEADLAKAPPLSRWTRVVHDTAERHESADAAPREPSRACAAVDAIETDAG